MKLDLTKELTACRCHSVFSDRSNGSATKKQESVYISYINNGVPTAKYLSTESTNNANTESVEYSINETFHRTGLVSLISQVVWGVSKLMVPMSTWANTKAYLLNFVSKLPGSWIFNALTIMLNW